MFCSTAMKVKGYFQNNFGKFQVGNSTTL